jgi:hypothetical protein
MDGTAFPPVPAPSVAHWLWPAQIGLAWLAFRPLKHPEWDCSCGWRSQVFGADKAAGTMDPLQRAADTGDLHEWEMSLR